MRLSHILLAFPLIMASLAIAAPAAAPAAEPYNMAGPPPGGYLADAANQQAVDEWNNADWGDGWNFKKEKV